MDKMQTIYAILNLRYPNGYRTTAGAKLWLRLAAMSITELAAELTKQQAKGAKV